MLIYLPIAELPVDMITLLLMGVVVGFISGLFGIGGGFLMTPLLIFYGLPPAVAVATVSSQIAASSTTGAVNYWRRRAIDIKLCVVLLSGGLIGTGFGIWVFNLLQKMGQLDLVIQVSYVTLLGGIGGFMLVESTRVLFHRRGTKRFPRIGWFRDLPLKLRFPKSGIYVSVLPLIGLGIFVGFSATVLGLGGGFLLVPALIYLFRVPTNVVIGTSLLQILVTMVAATLLHAITNQSVDAVLALLLIVGGVIGAQFGTRLGQRIKGEQFRFLLALLILAVGIRFAITLMVEPQEPFTLIGVSGP